MFPIINVDPVDEEAAFGDVEVFRFQFVALPGTDGRGVRMGDGVEAFYTFKMKIVYESYNSTMIFMNATIDMLHINGTPVYYRTLMTRIRLIYTDFFWWITFGYWMFTDFYLCSSARSVLSAFYS